jgi:hypothetical protein
MESGKGTERFGGGEAKWLGMWLGLGSPRHEGCNGGLVYP